MFRIAAYADLAYRRDAGALYAEMAFAHFLCALGAEAGRVRLVGRLSPEAPAAAHHRLPEDAELAPLPYYADASRPLAVARALPRTVRAFWRALDDADGALVFGPHPLATVFVLVALARRRRVALGIRQDYLAYIGSRHAGRRPVLAAARAIDAVWRLLVRFLPTIVVGPELARRHRHARRLLEITVSLVDEHELDAAPATRAAGDGELRVLSVGRLDREKNPLMLADVLASLRRDGEDWRLVVCGDGALREPLADRLREQGVADAAELLGHVPVQDGLRRRYRESDLLLHVSWTEGVPQVLLEAFAAGLPVVATDVGGVAAVTGGRAALLVPPGDPEAAARALRRVAAEPRLRAELVDAGLRIAREHTLQAECRRIAAFLRASWGPAGVPT